MIQARLISNTIKSNSKEAFTLKENSSFGEKSNETIIYSSVEALFLVETKKMTILNKNKPFSTEKLIKKFTQIDKKFPTKYVVFKDLRKKGYIVKSALKFGAEFTVYDKGQKPGKSHSKWLVFTETGTNKTTWHEFSSKNRVAHSTNKKLLLAIIDEQEKPLYYEISWKKI